MQEYTYRTAENQRALSVTGPLHKWDSTNSNKVMVTNTAERQALFLM